MKYLVMLMLLLITLPCYSDVYTETDSQGNITYSDSPSTNSKKIEMQETSAPPPVTTNIPNKPTITSPTPTSEESTNADEPYTKFLIKSPTDQQTFQNEREIPVEIVITPDLKKGDKIQLFVDGIPHGEASSSTVLTAKQLDRGMHVISAILYDKTNKILKNTKGVVIYVQYARLGTTKPGGN